MEILPAIDLKAGKCVRLYQGDYQQETVFSDDPVGVALKWQSLGGQWLHVVDLDGAAHGEPQNVDVVRAIVQAVHVPVQMGGGIRRLETVQQLLELGVQRVILGTAAVEDTNLTREICHRFDDAIIIGIDARNGYVETHGWQQQTQLTTLELARTMADLGAKRLICTDISRDGTLTEPNFDAIAELVTQIDLPLIAAGGISAISHLKRLREIGVEGAILGKALYTRDLDLQQAIQALGPE